MTNTTINTTTPEAATIIASIKEGKAPSKDAVKAAFSMDNIKGMFTSAWAAIKGYDYKAAIKSAWDKTLDAGMAFDQWCSTTKTGKAFAYTVKATSYLFVAGLFTHGAIGAVLGGAVLLTTADAFFSGKRPSLVDVVKSYAINVALMTAMVTAAWVAFPYVINILTWMYYTAVAGVILPLASVFL